MDVPGYAFGWELLNMHRSLSTSHFVAMYFEHSRIPNSQTTKGLQENQRHKPTLQQRYAELKIAAEKYQILQVGITIVNEDRSRG